MVAGFPEQVSQGSKARVHFNDPVLEVTEYHFCHTLLVKALTKVYTGSKGLRLDLLMQEWKESRKACGRGVTGVITSCYNGVLYSSEKGLSL